MKSNLTKLMLLTLMVNVIGYAQDWNANGNHLTYTDGYIGVNTTNPKAHLHVNGNIKAKRNHEWKKQA